MKARGIRRRRGSYIIEAAFIYPAIVLISTMLILLMLFLFSSIQDLSQTDAGVRRAAAEASETVWYGSGTESRYIILDRRNEGVEKAEAAEQQDGIVKSFSGKISRQAAFPAPFVISARSDSAAIWTSLDEAHIIRTADLVFEKIGID